MAQAARGLVVVGEMTGLPRLRARRLPLLRRGGVQPLATRQSASLNSVRKLSGGHLAGEAQRSQPRSLFPQRLLAGLILRRGCGALDPRFFFSPEKRFGPLTGVLRTHDDFPC